MPPLGGPRPWIKGTAVVLGLGLLVVAAARPRFGVYFEEVAQRGGRRVRRARCFQEHDRRGRRPQPTRTGQVGRSRPARSDHRRPRRPHRLRGASRWSRCRFTTDHGFFDMMLGRIDTESAPRGGSLIGDALRKAMEAMPPRGERDQAIVLITDGEDHESFPEEAARQAAERGIKIFTVGLGDSAEGGRIPIRDDAGQFAVPEVRRQGDLVEGRREAARTDRLDHRRAPISLPALGRTTWDKSTKTTSRASPTASSVARNENVTASSFSGSPVSAWHCCWSRWRFPVIGRQGVS